MYVTAVTVMCWRYDLVCVRVCVSSRLGMRFVVSGTRSDAMPADMRRQGRACRVV